MRLIDGPKLDMTEETKRVIEQAPARANLLRRIAREQSAMPSNFRLQLVGCAVTIEVLIAELEKVKPKHSIEVAP